VRRVRYQFGMLELVEGKKQDVWTFRFYESSGPMGNVIIGVSASAPRNNT
jgi:hypothetical protein